MISTKASAVSGPTPGCVISRCASGTLLHFLLDRLAQLRNGRVQSIQQLQQIAPSPAGPRSQPERFQLLPSAFPPQPLLAAQTFIERHGLQLVHDPRARLHHAVTMPQQLPQIPVLPAWHPDLREAILQQQRKISCASWRSVFCLRTRFVRISAASPIHNSNCNSASESFEPACMPAGFHPNPHLLARQRTVERSPPPHDALAAFPGTLRCRYPPKQFAETRGGNLLL